MLLLFGAKRLRGVGSDLGAAIKGFRSSMRDGEESVNKEKLGQDKVIEGEAVNKEKDKV